jgi:hydroxymethylbilane synthase
VRLRIASRKSDLARIQALAVGAALKKVRPSLEIIHTFRESLGDKNQNDPLWKMPERGVFTEDFREDLLEGEIDMVVHSWKDLPVENSGGTEIACTLPRADMRDLLLIPKERWGNVAQTGVIKIFSSSPRRSYNLTPFLSAALPARLKRVEFESVRGNIPTRLRKLFESETVHGLVLAKAAVDRILASEQNEFSVLRETIKEMIQRCHFMVLPLQINPAAAAQGALAVEIKSGQSEVRALLQEINCGATFEAANLERKILSGYGGGCHQKIGVSVIDRPYGQIISLKGLTDSGEILEKRELRRRPSASWDRVPLSKIWPGSENDDRSFFERQPLEALKKPSGPLFVARSNAWPEYWHGHDHLVWAAGIETWKKLASKGVWVNGCSEGLGESEDCQLDHLTGQKVEWTKITHEGGRGELEFLPTYRLIPRTVNTSSLSGKTHFYWNSASAFLRAVELIPEIAQGYHGCGPGNTFETLRKHLGGDDRLRVFLSHADWIKEVAL